MLASNSQLVIAVVQQTPTEEPRISAKIAAAETGFDRDFPNTCCAKYQLIASILKHPAGGKRQSLWLSSRPQQQLRVQQQLHEPFPKSRSSSKLPIRSK